MLVLSRKKGEAVQLGDDIIVVVTGILPNRVKLGFQAPADVTIKRCLFQAAEQEGARKCDDLKKNQ